MMTRHPGTVLLLIGVLAVEPAGAAPAPHELTLAQALAAAGANSPRLRDAAAAVEEARGRLTTARTYPHNPRVELEAADRDGADGSTTDRGIGLSQEIEIAGQGGKRAAAARAALAAAEATLERRRREVRAEAERAFADAVEARELLRVARSDVTLTGDLVDFAQRRLEAGAGTQIELNLASAAAGRAVHRAQRETAALAAARARLAEAVGMDPAVPPRPAGTLPPAPADLPPLAELTRRAAVHRSDLAAARQQREQAERRVSLERARRIPNLELGAFAAREEGAEIVGLRAGIALPLFDRNEGAVATALAALDRQVAQVDAGELAAGREVAAAYGGYRAAAEALTALGGLVVAPLEESLGLLRRAVEAGELSATDVLLLRRELVEGRREAIEVAGELWRARIDLELAVGGDLTVMNGEQESEREEDTDAH